MTQLGLLDLCQGSKKIAEEHRIPLHYQSPLKNLFLSLFAILHLQLGPTLSILQKRRDL